MAGVKDFLAGRDTINTKEAKFFITDDRGNVRPIIEATSLNAKIEKNKEDVKTFNSRFTKKKTTSLSGSGSYGGYTINSNFIKYALPYIETGKDFYCQLACIIEDPDSRAGKQTIYLKEVNFNDIPLFDLEADDGMMKQESDFTFEGVDVPELFNGTVK